ncbi:MAG: cyclic nucleotide-binding domain-containing protein [Rhodospirillales bacterium]
MADYGRRDFNDGDIIFAEGDRAAEAYLIQSGRVRLLTEESGIVREIDTIGKGRIFGEMAVISDMNRMATAQAMGDTVLVACHRREMQRRIDELDDKRRDALRFLILYCQDFLPFELMDARPQDDETERRDGIAYWLIHYANRPGELDGLDTFLSGLYKVLIGYAERRLPPGFHPNG